MNGTENLQKQVEAGRAYPAGYQQKIAIRPDGSQQVIGR